MANYKRKSNYKSNRSCGLCKPWKRTGNSNKLERRNPHSTKLQCTEDLRKTDL